MPAFVCNVGCGLVRSLRREGGAGCGRRSSTLSSPDSAQFVGQRAPCWARRRPRPASTAAGAGNVVMQLPPEKYQVPLSERDAGPKGYVWDENYPGTMKPGIGKLDNYPLKDVMQSDVYERMVYDEFDLDERVAEIFTPDEDLLEWLDRNGRLISKDAEGDDFDFDVDNQMSALTEDDLDFADDDSKMIAYYSRQSEGSTTGASSDFGGFSESNDYDTGF